MNIKLGVVMDPIQDIHPHKDSTLAMLLAAQQRGWDIHYIEMDDLSILNGVAQAETHTLQVMDDNSQWYKIGEQHNIPLSTLDAILMRKDPPFDREYLYATHILELAERHGSLIINRPQSLRDFNEKLATAWFPNLAPPSLVTRSEREIRDFLAEHEDVILKPLDAMGGSSIFRLRAGDPNAGVIIETLTNHKQPNSQHSYTMVQRFIPEISDGDKRVLMVDGEPIPYALARIPAPGDNRGNLAAGGRGVGVALSERDYEIDRKSVV